MSEFEQLLEEVMDGAYRLALRLTGSRDDAMDLVQDAAVQAFRGFSGFERGSNFRAWFYRIVTNRFYRLAQRKRPPTTVYDEADEEPYLLRVAMDASPQVVMDVLDRLDAEAVQQAIDRLPPEFRAVGMLYFLEELKYEEIAQALELPLGTVRSRLHRGRKLLQRELWAIAESRGLTGQGSPTL
ncbi:MAG: RNA polymerase sigma factor [Chthonomonas sp.]